MREEIQFFKGLTVGQKDLLEPFFINCYECEGTSLFKQGEEAEYLYLLINGEVKIQFKPDDGPEIDITKVVPEGIVGWSAAIGNPFYTSSAVCSTSCQLFRIRGEDLRELCKRDPELCDKVVDRLASLISMRLRFSREHVIELLWEAIGVKKEFSALKRRL